MSFKIWFKWWLKSWYRMILHGVHRPKSEHERRVARAKWREYESRKRHALHTGKKHKKARSGNKILLYKICGFLAATLAFALVPLGVFIRARRSRQIKAAVDCAAAKRASSTSAKSSSNSSQKTVKAEKKVENKQSNSSAKAPSNPSVVREKTEVKREENKEEKKPILQENVRVEALKTDEQSSENSPWSTPKNTNDTWIRKRMIAEIKREELTEEIKVGDTFDLILAEDKSVVLSRQNSPVATVRKVDTLPLATALKLGRRLYAVAVEMKENEIEFEGWQRQ